MIITNSCYALVGYFITSYRTRAHEIIVIYSWFKSNTVSTSMLTQRLHVTDISDFFYLPRSSSYHWNDIPLLNIDKSPTRKISKRTLSQTTILTIAAGCSSFLKYNSIKNLLQPMTLHTLSHVHEFSTFSSNLSLTSH